MSLNPSQQLLLVQQTRVQISVLSHPLARQEPQRADAVVEVDIDNVAARLLDDLGSIEPVADDGVPAALNEHPNWQLRGRCCVGRGEDVGEEAIL